MIDIIQIRKIIQDKIQSIYPDRIISNDYDRNSLITEADGKILVLFAGGQGSDRQGNLFGINDTEDLIFSIRVTMRDPLEQDLALEIISTLKTELHGLPIVEYDDRGRLNYQRTQFNEYEAESFQWFFTIDFMVQNILEVKNA